MKVLDLFTCYLIITTNLDVSSEFSQVLNQVVGERIVIIQDKNAKA